MAKAMTLAMFGEGTYTDVSSPPTPIRATLIDLIFDGVSMYSVLFILWLVRIDQSDPSIGGR